MTEYTEITEEPFEDTEDDFEYMRHITGDSRGPSPAAGDTCGDDSGADTNNDSGGGASTPGGSDEAAAPADAARRPVNIVHVRILHRSGAGRVAAYNDEDDDDDYEEEEEFHQEPEKNRAKAAAAETVAAGTSKTPQQPQKQQQPQQQQKQQKQEQEQEQQQRAEEGGTWGSAWKGGASMFKVDAKPLTREQKQYLDDACGTFFAILEDMLRVYQREPSREGVEEIFQFADSLRTRRIGMPAPADLLFDTLFADTFNGYDLRIVKNRIALLRLITSNYSDGLVDATAEMHTALRTNQLLPRLLPVAPKDPPPFFVHCFACGTALCSTFDLLTIERRKGSRGLSPSHTHTHTTNCIVPFSPSHTHLWLPPTTALASTSPDLPHRFIAVSTKGQDNILARVYCRTCLTVVATLFHWNFHERPDCTYAVVVFRKNKVVLRRRDCLFGLSSPDNSPA